MTDIVRLVMRYKGSNSFSTHLYVADDIQAGSAMNCRGIIQIFGALGLQVPTPETLSAAYYVLPYRPRTPGYKEMKLASSVYPAFGNQFPYMIRDTRYIGDYTGDNPFHDCAHVPISTELMIAHSFMPQWALTPYQSSSKLLSEFGKKLTSEYVQHKSWGDFHDEPYYLYSLWLSDIQGGAR